MEVKLERAILDQLSSRGILAYLAVRLADGTLATTASLAGLVRCQTAVMREGLNELAVAAPGAVGKQDGKWICGLVKAGEGEVVQILDSDRYRMFVDDLKKYWDHVNRNAIPFEMGAKDGIQIKGFLSAHKQWLPEDWRRALQHRAMSVLKFQNAPQTQPLWGWVGKLDSYLASPLDRYGKPVEGNGGKQEQIQNRNSEAAAAYLNGGRRA